MLLSNTAAVSRSRDPRSNSSRAERRVGRSSSRVEELGTLGLAAEAARDLEVAAPLAPPPARLRLLERAAEYAVRAGDDARALALDEQLAQAPGHRVAALARDAEALVRLGRFAAAGRVVTALAAEPAPLPEPAATTLQALHELGRLARPELQVAFDFRRPLHPTWLVPTPEAVRRDPQTGDLRFDLVGTDLRVLSVPLLWTGGPLAIELELELDTIEWGHELRVMLVDDDGRPWIGAGSGGGGGGGEVFQTLGVLASETGWQRLQELPRPAAGATRELRVRIGLLPRTGRGVQVFEHDGRIDRNSFDLAAVPPPGRYHLVFGTDHPHARELRITGAVRDLAVYGAVLDPQPDARAAGPAGVAARLLVDGRPAEALAALDAADTSPAHALLRGLALSELGDLAGARAAFTTAIAAGDDALDVRLLAALRRRSALALAVREALGPRFLLAAAKIWSPYFQMHGTIAADRPILREALAGLERVPPATPEQAAAYADLLTLRGLLAAHDGDDGPAIRDLEESLRRGPTEHLAVEAGVALVRLAADHPARAIALADMALGRSPAPDAVRLRLRGDPRLAILLGDPRWSVVIADPHEPRL